MPILFKTKLVCGNKMIAAPERLLDLSDIFLEEKQHYWNKMPPHLKRFMEKYENGDYAADSPASISQSGIWIPGKSSGALNEVWPGLFVGGELALDYNKLNEHKIDCILNMAIEIDYQVSCLGPEVVKLGINDGKLAPVGVFECTATIIHTALSDGKRMLVHCMAGISRSATAALSYLMRYQNKSFLESYKHIEARRPIVMPHPLLVRSLIRDFDDRFVAF